MCFALGSAVVVVSVTVAVIRVVIFVKLAVVLLVVIAVVSCAGVDFTWSPSCLLRGYLAAAVPQISITTHPDICSSTLSKVETVTTR